MWDKIKLSSAGADYRKRVRQTTHAFRTWASKSDMRCGAPGPACPQLEGRDADHHDCRGARVAEILPGVIFIPFFFTSLPNRIGFSLFFWIFRLDRTNLVLHRCGKLGVFTFLSATSMITPRDRVFPYFSNISAWKDDSRFTLMWKIGSIYFLSARGPSCIGEDTPRGYVAHGGFMIAVSTNPNPNPNPNPNSTLTQP